MQFCPRQAIEIRQADGCANTRPARWRRGPGTYATHAQLNVTFTDLALDSLTLQVATLVAWPATGA